MKREKKKEKRMKRWGGQPFVEGLLGVSVDNDLDVVLVLLKKI